MEVFGGFGSHMNSPEASKRRVELKVDSLKEAGTRRISIRPTSKIQPIQDPAKADKQVHRTHLGFLCQTKLKNKTINSQRDILHCGLAIVRNIKENGHI